MPNNQGMIYVKCGPKADQLIPYFTAAEATAIIAEYGAANCLDADTADMARIQAATTPCADYHTIDEQGHVGTSHVSGGHGQTHSSSFIPAVQDTYQTIGFWNNALDSSTAPVGTQISEKKLTPEIASGQVVGLEIENDVNPTWGGIAIGGLHEITQGQLKKITGFKIAGVDVPIWQTDLYSASFAGWDSSTSSTYLSLTPGENGLPQATMDAIRAALLAGGTLGVDVSFDPAAFDPQPALTGFTFELFDASGASVTTMTVAELKVVSWGAYANNGFKVVATPAGAKPPTMPSPLAMAASSSIKGTGGVKFDQINGFRGTNAAGTLTITYTDPHVHITSTPLVVTVTA